MHSNVGSVLTLSLMSQQAILNMAHLMSELSNEIYDSQTGVDLSESDGVCGTCPYTVFLGVLVALLPKVPAYM